MQKQLLSPENFIINRARTLPIHEVWISENWKKYGISTIIVARKHNQGNFTIGVYMVDLFCLGVKDTFFVFNKEEEEFYQDLLKKIKNSKKIEKINYDLAHNIIFKAIDFADAIKIKPHKDFKITKFILEDEDNESIPYMEIACGDPKDGKPHLFITEGMPEFVRFLPHLEKYVGKGNFYFTGQSNFLEKDENDFEEDFEEEEEEEDPEEEKFLDIIRNLDHNQINIGLKKCIQDLLQKYQSDIRDFSKNVPKIQPNELERLKIESNDVDFANKYDLNLLLLPFKLLQNGEINASLKSLVEANSNNPHIVSMYLKTHEEYADNIPETEKLFSKYAKLFPTHLLFKTFGAGLLARNSKLQQAFDLLRTNPISYYIDKNNGLYNQYLLDYYSFLCIISIQLNDIATFAKTYLIFDSLLFTDKENMNDSYLVAIQEFDKLITPIIGDNDFVRELMLKNFPQ